MKKTVIALGLALLAGPATAQTLNVVVGEVTYQVPAAEAGDMPYSGGSAVTILGKTFATADIDRMYVDNTTVTDNTVSVAWNGTTADVRVAGNVARHLTVTATGADVSIVQDNDLADEITYTLSGTSTDGSFFMDGKLKATIVLNGLNLTNADGYAIDIEDGKRIEVQLAEGTVNTLADGAGGSQKACFMVNGHTEFKGGGSLTITGNAKHAFWGDEYVEVKKSAGTITVAKAAADGFNVNQYFRQNGGTIIVKNVGDDGIQVSADGKEGTENDGMILLYGGTQDITVTATAAKGLKADSRIIVGEAAGGDGGSYTVTTNGGGKWDSDDNETKASAAMKTDASIIVNAGTLTLTATGAGGKGMAADSTITINGGNVTVKTTGARYTYGSGGNSSSSSYHSSAKGIKAKLAIEVNGGAIDVTTTGGEGSEGIESKDTYTQNGGDVNIYSYDDAINCAKNMYIKGGTVTVVSSNNDGLDANNNIYISGGTVASYGSRAPECGIDAAEGYNIYFTGGTILGVGGTSSTPSNSQSTQAFVNVTSTVTASTTISVSNGSTVLASFTVPSTYSSNNGGGGGPRWSAGEGTAMYAPGDGGGGPGGGGDGPGGGGDGPGGGGGGGGGRDSSTYIMISTPAMTSGTSYTVTSGTNTVTGTATTASGSRW